MYEGSYTLESETSALIRHAGSNLSVETLTLLLTRGGGDPEKALHVARILVDERKSKEVEELEERTRALQRNLTALHKAASPTLLGGTAAELLRNNRARPRSKRKEEHTIIAEFLDTVIRENLEDE